MACVNCQHQMDTEAANLLPGQLLLACATCAFADWLPPCAFWMKKRVWVYPQVEILSVDRHAWGDIYQTWDTTKFWETHIPASNSPSEEALWKQTYVGCSQIQDTMTCEQNCISSFLNWGRCWHAAYALIKSTIFQTMYNGSFNQPLLAEWEGQIKDCLLSD